MTVKIKARADVRVLVGGLVLGSVVGAALGGVYWAGDRAQAADAQVRAVRLTRAAADGFSLRALQTQAAALPPGAAAIAVRQPTRLPVLKVSTAAKPFHMADAAGAPTRDVDCLAEAVYYEARGESPQGQAAIAQVVLNRVRHPAFPKSVCGVVYQGAGTGGCQFSFACNGAMDSRREAAAWTRARFVAERALAGFVMPLVGNATHFHVLSARPDWGGLTRVAQIGMHVFYRFGGGAGAPQRFNAQVEPSAPGSDRAARTILASMTSQAGRELRATAAGRRSSTPWLRQARTAAPSSPVSTPQQLRARPPRPSPRRIRRPRRRAELELPLPLRERGRCRGAGPATGGGQPRRSRPPQSSA